MDQGCSIVYTMCLHVVTCKRMVYGCDCSEYAVLVLLIVGGNQAYDKVPSTFPGIVRT